MLPLLALALYAALGTAGSGTRTAAAGLLPAFALGPAWPCVSPGRCHRPWIWLWLWLLPWACWPLAWLALALLALAVLALALLALVLALT